MISTIQGLLKRLACADDRQPQSRDEALRTATIALLMEVACADAGVNEDERLLIEQIISRNYEVTADQARDMALLAEAQAEQSTSLYPVTRLITSECSLDERIAIIRLLWQVTFADGHVDKHEEHLVRKVADLLYVPHNQFIKTKLQGM